MAPIRLGKNLFNVDSLVPDHYLISMDLARPGNYPLSFNSDRQSKYLSDMDLARSGYYIF